jgi:putative ABC transport system permease protein
MTQSIRERIPELAVLKTYGYSDGRLVAIVCAEALILCGAAALAGLTLAATVFPAIFEAIGAPSSPTPPIVLVVGAGLAALLAVASAALPVWHVRKLSVVDALAGRLRS